MREISFYDVDTDRLHVLCLGTETKTEGYVSAAEIAASYVMMIDQFNYVFPRVMKVRLGAERTAHNLNSASRCGMTI